MKYNEVNPFNGNNIEEDAPANATGPSVAGTGDDNTVHTKKKKKNSILEVTILLNQEQMTGFGMHLKNIVFMTLIIFVSIILHQASDLHLKHG